MWGLSGLMTYLIIINAVGFIAFLINTVLYTFTEEGQIDILLTIVSLAGGSLGIVLAILIFDRNAEKQNMMSRVFVFSILVIQIVIFLVLRGHYTENISFAFWEFFGQHKALIAYLVIINFVSFALFAMDKIAAIEGRSRIRIVTLLALAFFGGSIGGTIAMYLLRHKTQTDYFTVGIPLIMIMQVVVLFYAMNAAW